MAETNTNGQHSQQPTSSTDEQSTRDADGSKIMANAELLTTATTTELSTDALDHFIPEGGR